MGAKMSISRSTILQLIGFAALLIITWLDAEIFLPKLFHGVSTSKINLISSALETVWICLLAWYVLFIQYRSSRRIKILEGILPICSFCKKIRKEGDWFPIEDYVRDHSGADFSHGLCPECGVKHYGDLYLRSQKKDL